MTVGTVKSVVAKKGFGFISTGVAGDKDLFFHATQLASGLEFNEQLNELRVEFDVVDGPKGPRAVNVRAAG